MMGYSHYWRRVPEFNKDAFFNAANEISELIEYMEKIGVRLAGPEGVRNPISNIHTIAFNGDARCGHPFRDIGKPWPSDKAEGVAAPDNPISPEEPWAFGPHLIGRACGGNCAGGAFIVDRKFLMRDWDRMQEGLYFGWCDTDYKPYDLAVTAALIRLKENLGDEIILSSSGGERAFADAQRICRELFGWPKRFEIELQEPQPA